MMTSGAPYIMPCRTL